MAENDVDDEFVMCKI